MRRIAERVGGQALEPFDEIGVDPRHPAEQHGKAEPARPGDRIHWFHDMADADRFNARCVARARAINWNRRTVSSSHPSRCPSTSLTDQRSWVRGRSISRSGSRAMNASVDRRVAPMRRTASRCHLTSDVKGRVTMMA